MVSPQRFPFLLAGSVALAFVLTLLSGCDGRPLVDTDPSDGGTAEATASETMASEGTTVATSTMATSASDETAGDETATTTETGEATDCHTPRPIPPSPFDCRGVDGVLTHHVGIEEGGHDPSILSGIRRVEGSVFLHTADITNLDFMGCLQEVTGGITIFDNDQLTNVDGLWNIREIGTDFVFANNDALVIFDGLPNLETFARGLFIHDNGSLEELNGFQSLMGLEGIMFIIKDGQGWEEGFVSIHSNPVLRHIDGLGGLTVVNGTFTVTDNPMLCCSSVACVGENLLLPIAPEPTWMQCSGNDHGC
ncbi:receptor L domain-containing protein [Paraliomyxa miuraensis]|uniref:hypothetical protein n=1 Tax=Paraliomyxa miuraensis TaxID=376150 RepID=UPI002251EDB5|nr:hypothetical protein [Paraliomyxa miuraensis]MCX4243614.1 hypothetical protein [Paraliomyxa miuraensis]